MKKFFFFLVVATTAAFSQSPAGIWYFGKKAGISFNLGNNPISLDDGQIDTNEGCATLCDNSGNLLFYTDGIKVWNRNHLVMPNGSGLLGDPSSTQSAIIVPKPNSAFIFYVFTVDELGKSNGLKYSIIDLSLDNGLGDITTKNVSLISLALEKITVVQHANGINYWVIAHRYGNNQYLAYELSSTGLSTTPVATSVGVSIANDTQRTLGYMKSSPNGQYIATAHAGTASTIDLLKFNNTTGQLSLIGTLPINSNSLGVYGIEFSSNSKLLYTTRIDYPSFTSEIIQFNIESLNATTINQSQVIVGSYIFDEFFEGVITALQLAPNQKIYVGRNNYNFLGVIESPNTVGVNCGYIEEDVNLGSGICYYGLPSFITSYLDLNFTASNYCNGSATQFNAPQINDVVSLNWNFGDTLSLDNTSTDDQPQHLFTSSGIYNVSLTVQTLTNTKVFNKQISILASPVANQPTDFTQCETAPNEAEFILSSKNQEILDTQIASNYVITYHLSQTDADNNDNSLNDTYTNISNPQTIFARIQPISSNECYDVTSFKLKTNGIPKLKADESLFYCLNSYPQQIILSAENLNPSEVLTYQWSTAATSETISINQAAIYTVKATNAFGCSAIRTITVTNSEIATINYTILGEIGSNSLQVIPIGSGTYVYSLDNEFGNYQTNPVFDLVTSGDHIVYVKDSNGCGIANANFSVVGYPKYFTPNNDGYNDTWNLTGSFITIKKTIIFDRFGKLLFSTNSNSVGWDGKLNGQILPATDYWFISILENNKEIRGHFSLKR